jgi:hypothetical protein
MDPSLWTEPVPGYPYGLALGSEASTSEGSVNAIRAVGAPGDRYGDAA